MIDTVYETFIAKSRYARYLDDKARRENWGETVDRYLDFMQDHLLEKHEYLIPEDTLAEIKGAITEVEVFPSMRALMTAGEALERDNTAGFNCSYLPVDDIKSFDEAMYILMCGVGVGFSVERQYICKLPEVPDRIYPSESYIMVHDSKEGWAKALRQLIALLYSGEAAKWDVSEVRPAGARLKTFGGRASGPGPLVDLFRFVTKIFKGAVGRKLTSLECHDIMCKIGEVVVVGGVRRSAMISLSNLSDDRMRHAKSGAWWEANPQRALANNSACYTERPDVGVFMQEWLSLYESKSGERGIFNREAATKVAARNGRRDTEGHDFGTNPCCVTGDTVILTDKGHIPIKDTVGVPTNIWNGTEFIEVVPYTTGIATIYRVELSNGSYIDCTKNHKFALHDGYVNRRVKGTEKRILEQKIKLVELQHLSERDRLAKFDMPVIQGIGGMEVDAYSQGFYSGDGCSNSTRSYIYEPKYPCITRLVGKVLEEESSTKRRGWVHGNMLAKDYVPINLDKEIVLQWLAGYFDADGTVTSDINGDGIQVSSIDKNMLNNVRLLLTRLGISSKIQLASKDRKFQGYECKPLWRLLIGNQGAYNLLIMGMLCERLQFRYQEPNRDASRFVTIKTITCLNTEEMTYCFTESKTGLGTFNGVVTGQSEIILRPYQFCNLSTIVVRATDTREILLRKIRVAAILGTFQSTLTNFPYLRKIWQKNTEEERLLGVSMTGPLDNPLLNNPDDPELKILLEDLKAEAVRVNKVLALQIGIPQATAVSAIKPEGTTSERADSASGLHTRHAPFYTRRIRGDMKDPLTQFMMTVGVPWEPDVMKPDSTVVFSFAKKAPKGALVKSDLSAIQHLKLWLAYQRFYCEHKPSITVSVKENEWPMVGAFVWEHFDEMSGVSFLPDDGGSYRQAPYEECTEEEYEELLAKIPKHVDWDSIIETDDNVEGAQTLACSAAGGCSIL